MGAIAECLDEKQGRAVPERSDAKRMRALTLVADRKVELIELNAPTAPGAGEVQIRVRAVARLLEAEEHGALTIEHHTKRFVSEYQAEMLRTRGTTFCENP
jgi:hypothetical protein